jgi:hypothetical protein
MVNRINTNAGGELDKSGKQDTAAAINYFPERRTSRRLQTQDISGFDDLIVSLANTYENRRARQVVEWERMRRQNFPLSV